MTDDAGNQPPPWPQVPPGQPLYPPPPQPHPPGQAPAYGQPPYGQAPYGQAPYGQSPYPPQPYGQPPLYATQAFPPRPAGPQNGFGITGLACGAVSALFVGLRVGDYFAILIGIVGLVFGLIGFVRGRRGRATNKGVALLGAVLAFGGIVGGVSWIVYDVNHVSRNSDFNKLIDCLNHLRTEPNGATDCPTPITSFTPQKSA